MSSKKNREDLKKLFGQLEKKSVAELFLAVKRAQKREEMKRYRDKKRVRRYSPRPKTRKSLTFNGILGASSKSRKKTSKKKRKK